MEEEKKNNKREEATWIKAKGAAMVGVENPPRSGRIQEGWREVWLTWGLFPEPHISQGAPKLPWQQEHPKQGH